jgi:hypothetical protein
MMGMGPCKKSDFRFNNEHVVAQGNPIVLNQFVQFRFPRKNIKIVGPEEEGMPIGIGKL